MAVLAVLIVGVVVFLSSLLRSAMRWFFSGVNPTVTAAIVAGVATTVISVFTVVIGRYLERRSAIEAEIRKSKTPVYSELVTSYMSIFNSAMEEKVEEGAAAKPEGTTAKQAVGFVEVMQKLTPQLLTWAGDDVLVKWSRYRRLAGSLDPIDSMFELEKVFVAIRKDIGHSNRKVGKGDVLGLFVNDIHEYLDRPAGGKGSAEAP